MKKHDHQPKPKTMPRLQTLSECPREEGHNYPAHSNGGLDARSTTNNISVQFAPLSQTVFEVRIKQSPRKPAQPQEIDSLTLLIAAFRASATIPGKI
jgi:hypothetical protein